MNKYYSNRFTGYSLPKHNIYQMNNNPMKLNYQYPNQFNNYNTMTQFYIVNHNGGPEIISKNQFQQTPSRPNSNLMAINDQSKLNQYKGFSQGNFYHYGNYFPEINQLYNQVIYLNF
jgi:hypothetical protein